MSISSFFSDIKEFLSGTHLDEDAQTVVDEVQEVSEAIQESNRTTNLFDEQEGGDPLQRTGTTLPTPQEPLEELDDNATDEDNDTILPEEYIPIVNPQDNICTNNPDDTSCDKKIVDAYFAHKGEKAVASSEVGSYTFNNPYILLKDNTTGRQKVIDDILKYIVKNRLGGKYANDTTKANIDTALPYEKLGKNVPITFDIYNSETQETTSYNAIIKNRAGTYDGRKSIPTKKREGVVNYIVSHVKTPNDGKKYITTKKDVEEALTKKSYAKNDVVENIKLYRVVDDYTKITKANLASKVYLVAKTKNFRKGTSVKFKIFESGDKLLSDYVNDKEELPFLLGTNEKTEVMGQVVTADVDDPTTGNALEGRVAIEIALRPKKDKPTDENDTSANLEDWKKKFKKSETDTKEKEDKLYLKVSTTDYPNIEEQSFLVGEELVVKSAGCSLTKDILKQIFPNSTDVRRGEVVSAFNKYCDEFKINTLDRIAHFLGQIGTETGELMKLEESYNYSGYAIYKTFLKVHIDHPTQKGKKTYKYHDLIEGYNADLTDCKNGYIKGIQNLIVIDSSQGNFKTKADYNKFNKIYSIKSEYIRSKTLFDYVYGCRMGNGKKSTKDGSDYFGVGFIHMTGKSKYKVLHKIWNQKYPNDTKDFLGDDISLLKTDVDVALKAAMIIWEYQKLNTIAIKKSAVKKVSYIVNGGYNGLSNRKKYTKKAYEVLEKVK